MLESAGHTVITATSSKAIVTACQGHSPDVVVIGQESSSREKRRVFGLIRKQYPRARIIEIYALELGKILEEADDWLAIPKQAPTDLIELIDARAKRRSHSAG
jgi:CheY-like chemotaxis protein